MIKSTILKVSAIVVSAVAMVSLSPFFASANNHEDEDWTFTVGEYGATGYVAEAGRNKLDTSCAYIKCTRAIKYSGAKGSGFLAVAYGSNSAKSGFFNCTYNGNSSKTYNIQQGSEVKMINYIKEAGYSYANIWYNASGVANTTFDGVWSPDSI